MVRHLARAIVSSEAEVVEFKGWAQLRGPQKDGTFVPILMHGESNPIPDDQYRLSQMHEGVIAHQIWSS